MKKKSSTLKKEEKIKKQESLKNLISTNLEIKRDNIIEAEEISFNNSPPKNITYDEFGFITNNKNNSINQK